MGQCKHILANGEQCRNIAMEGRRHCWRPSHSGTADIRDRFRSIVSSHYFGFWSFVVGLVISTVVAVALAVYTAPRLTPSISEPHEPGNPSSSTISVTNGLIPMNQVTILVGLKESCTRGTPMCNPPMFPDPKRYDQGLFMLGLKALGHRNLGPYGRLDLPMYRAINLMPSKAFPHPDWYVDAAVVVEYEWPILHIKQRKVYPIYTGRLGEWKYG